MSTLDDRAGLPDCQKSQSPLDRDDLPPSTTDTIVLDLATSVEREQTWRIDATEWSGLLTENSYIDRERQLNDESNNILKPSTWILTSADPPLHRDGCRYILASCEIFDKPAYVTRGGVLREVHASVVASVYVRPEHRGKGYAKRLMSLVAAKLNESESHKNEHDCFSTLYSDIGTTFYTTFGWRPIPSKHIGLKPITHDEYQASLTEGSNKIQEVDTTHLKTIAVTSDFEQRLKRISATNPNTTYIALQPNMAQFGWHFAREDFAAEYLGLKASQIRGVEHSDTGILIVWTRTFGTEPSKGILHILHIDVPPTPLPTEEIISSLSVLLVRAQLEACEWKLEAGIEIWHPQPECIEAVRLLTTDFEVVERTHEHVCCVKWEGPGAEDLVWYAPEYYTWS